MSDSVGRPGNQTEGSRRPLGVSQDEWERAVRETLASQVVVPRPLAVDPAGRVIRRANRLQRRRTLSGLALAVVATVAVSTGMAQLREKPGPPASPTVVLGDPYASTLSDPTPSPARSGPDTGPAMAEADLIAGGVLATAQGRRVTLTGVGPVERAQRLPDGSGWLAVGAPTTAGRFLWSVSPAGVSQVLLAGAEEIALSRDGRRVVWRQGTELAAAGIAGGQVVDTVRTVAPVTALPVSFLGDDVLVRLDTGRPGYTLWHPGVGSPTPGADRATVHVYGNLPDGRVVGQISVGTARQACLAVLDPARDFAQVRTGCGPTLSADGRAAVSPDGRWLLVNGRTEGKERALLVDLERLATDPAARPVGPPMTGTVAWTSERAALYGHPDGGLVRVSVDKVLAGEPASTMTLGGLRPGEQPVVVTGW